MTTDQALHPTSPSANHPVAQDPISYVQDSGTADDAASTGTGLAPAALSLLGAALLAACGGGGGGGSASSNSASGFNNYPTANNDNEAARFLLQGQLSASDAEISTVRGSTFADYLQQQYAKPVGQTGWDWLDMRGYNDPAAVSKYIGRTELADFMVWNQLFTAPDNMRKRVALALSEFFVVSIQSMEIDWRGYTMAAYWDVLNQYAFGNYRDLLEEITLNPAMGYYLNTKGNQKEDIAKGRQPDENYAREVMQLFTIGLNELNLDGTDKLNAQGKKIDTYDADDVSQLARVFTGYDYDPKDKYRDPAFSYDIYRREYARKRMVLDENKHSKLAVSFLNVNIPANTPGLQALKIALDGLFNHPNTGPFFAKQMIQRLVTSNPSPAYVARVASAFNNNGQGVRGDLQAVWTAILLDDDARGPQGLTDSGFGKVREPMLRFVQWGRSFGVSSLKNSWKIFDLSNSSYDLGQSPLHSPSVFNFFRPGYVPSGTVLAERGAPAPEMQLVNETTVGGYINFMFDTIRNGRKAPEPSQSEPLYTNYIYDIVPNYAKELTLINNTGFTDAEASRVAQSYTARLNTLLCAGQLSNASASEIQNALKAALIQKKIVVSSTEKDKLDWVAAGLLMTMSSADYLVQK
jgi:uncharacterized protein (DUF1800 family)